MRAVLLATGETLPAWGRSASACPAVAKGEEFVTRTLVNATREMKMWATASAARSDSTETPGPRMAAGHVPATTARAAQWCWAEKKLGVNITVRIPKYFFLSSAPVTKVC